MKCPKCDAENRFNAINCEACGASLLESPPDEPLDLNRFAPAHSDPLVSPARKIPEVSQPDDSDEGHTGEDFAEKAKKVWSAVCAFLVLAAGKVWEFLKKAFAKIKEWLNAASAWIAVKIRQMTDKNDENSEKRPDDDDDEAGERFRKIVLAVMLGVLVLIFILLFSFCGACSSCSCAACSSDSLAGTWVGASGVADGYDSYDTIIELNGDGSVVIDGMTAGSYEFSEDILDFTINGMEYSAQTAVDAEELSASLHGYDSVTLDLVKLSDDTGLTADEIADLYPDE